MGYKVAVLMGSPNDGDKMAPAGATLERYGIEADVKVMSAHRSPALVSEFISGARDAGYQAVICGAGMAADLYAMESMVSLTGLTPVSTL